MGFSAIDSMSPMQSGLLSAGLSMLQNSQPSPTPTNLADVLASGFNTGIASYIASGGELGGSTQPLSQGAPENAIPDPVNPGAYSVPLGEPSPAPTVMPIGVPSQSTVRQHFGGGSTIEADSFRDEMNSFGQSLPMPATVEERFPGGELTTPTQPRQHNLPVSVTEEELYSRPAQLTPFNNTPLLSGYGEMAPWMGGLLFNRGYYAPEPLFLDPLTLGESQAIDQAEEAAQEEEDEGNSALDSLFATEEAGPVVGWNYGAPMYQQDGQLMQYGPAGYLYPVNQIPGGVAPALPPGSMGLI